MPKLIIQFPLAFLQTIYSKVLPPLEVDLVVIPTPRAIAVQGLNEDDHFQLEILQFVVELVVVIRATTPILTTLPHLR